MEYFRPEKGRTGSTDVSSRKTNSMYAVQTHVKFSILFKVSRALRLSRLYKTSEVSETFKVADT